MKKKQEYSSKKLKEEILHNAKALNIAEKWAETVADKTVKHVDKWVKGRGAVTESDIRRVASEKLETLNPDIAYIFKNRGKII